MTIRNTFIASGLAGCRAFIRLLLPGMLILPQPALALDNTLRTAQSILHMLDYVSVDYGGAVLLERVLNDNEYNEQLEFSKRSAMLLGELPMHPDQLALMGQAQELTILIQAKSPAEQVRATAQQLRQGIISAYEVPVTPERLPDLAHAAVLFQQLCAKCHGPQGHGDGEAGLGLDPKPADFHNMARMNQRSLYGLYNTISLGVSGTEMRNFAPKLSEDERWSLAFYVSNLRNRPDYLEQGRALWEHRQYRGPAPDLMALTFFTSNEVVLRYGEDTRAVYAYLRAHPEALSDKHRSTLAFAAEQLDQAAIQYRSGDRAKAQRLAIAAYLEGFEPMEISLDNLDKELRLSIEREMLQVRQLIDSNGSVDTVAEVVGRTKILLSQADELLRGGKLSVSGAFISSMLVLLREGLEGMLVLAAIISFVARSGRREAMLYIHAGWGAAVLLGIATWIAATWLVDISGAGREITEGVTSLVAAVMLIYVGFWLHGKSQAMAWKNFLQDQVGGALERKTLWALALVTFFAVYREIFETVLFYQALWAQVGENTRPALWMGMLIAAILLLGTGWGVFRFGIRLPIGPFFTVMSILLGTLAVIFAGQGIAALQEAGTVPISEVNFVSLPMLGIHPTFQTLLGQSVVIGILIFFYRAPRAESTGSGSDKA